MQLLLVSVLHHSPVLNLCAVSQLVTRDDSSVHVPRWNETKRGGWLPTHHVRGVGPGGGGNLLNDLAALSATAAAAADGEGIGIVWFAVSVGVRQPLQLLWFTAA